ncbi:MAG: hypothetical protein HYX90_02705 [Chloroflexi bacterium]|nr:hypothetical protein [Chloroflexota bacterium]
MVKVQVTVTPNEAKRLIARAVSQMPAVRSALANGRITLKGGTTVSAVAEELASIKLKISGRITQQGTKSSKAPTVGIPRVLLESGQVKDIESDSVLDGAVLAMGKNDVMITGANALDVNRKAAIMVGHPLGGQAKPLPFMMARGITTIIVVGWEKLIPGTIEQAVLAAGRDTVDVVMGMAVGLVPLFGTVVTETDAASLLAGVATTVIGAGGVTGGEGSTTFIVEGERANVEKAWDLVNSLKGATVSGVPESLVECGQKDPRCSTCLPVGKRRVVLHRSCVYRQPGLARTVLSTKQ